MKLFFSYARPDRDRADALAQRLRQAGNEVWLDTELTGGQVWWDKILDQVRRCDALVMMVSWASIKSQACMHERLYATRLGKSVLPVAVEQIRAEVLPSDIGRLQVIDYSRPSEMAAFQLIGSIMKLPPPPPLPEPLPEAPLIPISYLAAISDRLSKPDLSRDDQFAIVGILEEALGSSDPGDRASALDLLTEMEGRNDLLAAVARRIAALKGATGPRTESTQGWGAAQDTGSAPITEMGTFWRDRAKSEAWQDRAKSEAWRATGAPGGPAAGDQDQAERSSRSRTVPPKWEWPPSGNEEQWQPPAEKSQPPPRRQSPPRQEPPTTTTGPQVIVAINPHWAMAIWSVFFFWPIGVASVVYASRVKPAVASGDLAAARQASSRVKVMFWLSLAALIAGLVILIIAVNASNPNYGSTQY